MYVCMYVQLTSKTSQTQSDKGEIHVIKTSEMTQFEHIAAYLSVSEEACIETLERAIQQGLSQFLIDPLLPGKVGVVNLTIKRPETMVIVEPM